MIREIVWNSLRGDTVLNALGIAADGSNIHQADSVDTLPVKPAMVIRWGDITDPVGERGATAWVGGGTQTLQVWAHDDLGDFDRIDKILTRVRTVLSGLVAVQGTTPGQTLIQADWVGDSQDFRDDGYRTITRHSDWRIAQGWR
jgi:hypothetical protein